MSEPTKDELATALRRIWSNDSNRQWLWSDHGEEITSLLARYDASAKATSVCLNEGTPAGNEISRLRREVGELRDALRMVMSNEFVVRALDYKQRIQAVDALARLKEPTNG